MGRIYTVSFDGVAVTAVQDLFEIVAPADSIVLIHELQLSQETEIADAQEEMLNLVLKSGQTTSGSGGTAPTAIPRLFADAAAGTTAEVNNTTEASTGTIVTHQVWNWNVRIPFVNIWTPETRPVLSPSRRATIEMTTTPADSITMGGTLVIEEIGG